MKCGKMIIKLQMFQNIQCNLSSRCLSFQLIKSAQFQEKIHNKYSSINHCTIIAMKLIFLLYISFCLWSLIGESECRRTDKRRAKSPPPRDVGDEDLSEPSDFVVTLQDADFDETTRGLWVIKFYVPYVLIYMKLYLEIMLHYCCDTRIT